MRLSRISRRSPPREESIIPPPRASFVVRRFRGSHWPFTWHRHREIELTLIVRGSGSRHVGPMSEPFADGDCVLLGPDLPHSWASEPGPGVRVESIVAQFPPDLLAGLRAEECARVRNLLEQAGRGVVFAEPCADAFIALVGMPPGPGRIAALIALLGRLAMGPHRHLLAEGSRPGRHDDRWARLLEAARTQPERLPPQAAAAARAGMAPASFARAFQRRFATTYAAWRTRLRLQAACTALAETERSIADIALATGFSSISAFNRRFLASFGTSPRRWRAAAGDAYRKPAR